MSRLLLVTHGMGVHDKEWFPSIRDKLNEVAARYDKFQSSELSDAVDIVPVTYDDVFRGHLERWQEARDDLHAFVQKSHLDLGAGTTVLEWLDGAAEEENNFFWSHVVDVLLYRYVRDVRTHVRVSFMEQVASAVEERMREGDVEVTVLAHSLGTSVAHDSLHLLGTIPLGTSRIFLADNDFYLKGFCTLANVSRVLETSPGPYQSVIFPRTPERAGYISRFLNFTHVLDPIPAVRAFRPTSGEPGFFADIGLDHLRGFNVHDYEHYLDSPRVHIPLLNLLVPRPVKAGEARGAVADYERIEGIDCTEELDTFVQSAKRIVDLARGTKDPARLIIAGAQFLAAAKEAANACKGGE